ncbi:MAG TPA: phenylalanine--tRNA ligase subunit alpha, partial [Methanomicrobiales archaeon]|nr:phenylalanine--tRNA ligase subunit alpha [Methanomicrobiales archaeon]
MTAELTLNERKLLAALAPLEKADAGVLAEELGTTKEAVVQYAQLAATRGLVEVEKEVETRYLLTQEGQKYASEGLPERQLYDSFGESIDIRELQKHPLSKIGIGWLKKKGWASIQNGQVEKTGPAPLGEDEQVLRNPGAGGKGATELLKRGLMEEDSAVHYIVSITPPGEALIREGLP